MQSYLIYFLTISILIVSYDKLRYESECASIKSLRQDREEWRSRLEKRKADLERLKAGTMKNGPREAFEYNQKYADEILNSKQHYFFKYKLS